VSPAELAGAVNLPALAAELNLSDLADKLNHSQLEEVAERAAEHIDISGSVRDYFENNTFRFREA
jgi:hypothetical protein